MATYYEFLDGSNRWSERKPHAEGDLLLSTNSCHPFFHQMNPSRLPIFHFKRQAAQSLLGSNPLELAFQFRNYDRKRYKFGRSFCKNRSRIRKRPPWIWPNSTNFFAIEITAFHGHIAEPIPFHVQFQLKGDLLNKPLNLSTTLPRRVSSAGDQRILLFSVRFYLKSCFIDYLSCRVLLKESREEMN